MKENREKRLKQEAAAALDGKTARRKQEIRNSREALEKKKQERGTAWQRMDLPIQSAKLEPIAEVCPVKKRTSAVNERDPKTDKEELSPDWSRRSIAVREERNRQSEGDPGIRKQTPILSVRRMQRTGRRDCRKAVRKRRRTEQKQKGLFQRAGRAIQSR